MWQLNLPLFLLPVHFLALLATLTAPCPPSGLIRRIIAADGLVYVRAIIPEAYTPILDSYSEDGGQSWQFVPQVPVNIAQELEQEVRLPKIVCDPMDMQYCYRITGQEQVEESVDGGGSWRIGWSLPEERRSYMERVVYCGKPIQPGPYDLALIKQDGMRALIVALGSEGVLVHTAAGVWERYTVVPGYGIGPTPYVAENISAALSALPAESVIWLLVGLFTLLYLWRRNMNVMLEAMKTQLGPERSASWATRRGGWLLVAVISLCLLGYAMLSFNAGAFMMIDTTLEFLLAGLVIVFLLLSFILSWKRVADIVHQPRQAWLAAGISILTAIAIFPLAWLPFLLWAFGMISRYEFALALSILLTALSLWWGIRRASRASHMATTSIIEAPRA